MSFQSKSCKLYKKTKNHLRISEGCPTLGSNSREGLGFSKKQCHDTPLKTDMGGPFSKNQHLKKKGSSCVKHSVWGSNVSFPGVRLLKKSEVDMWRWTPPFRFKPFTFSDFITCYLNVWRQARSIFAYIDTDIDINTYILFILSLSPLVSTVNACKWMKPTDWWRCMAHLMSLQCPSTQSCAVQKMAAEQNVKTPGE